MSDTLNSTFQRIVSSNFEKVDLVVQQKNEWLEERNIDIASAPRFASLFSSDQSLPVRLIDELSDHPEVAAVNISVANTVSFSSASDAETAKAGRLRAWYSPEEQVGIAREITSGREPISNNEAVIDEGSFKSQNLQIGDVLHVNHGDHSFDITLVGTTNTAATTPVSTQPQLAMSESDYLSNLTEGVTVGGLQIRLVESAQDNPSEAAQVLQGNFPDFQFVTGESLSNQLRGSLNTALQAIHTSLFSFAAIALIMGVFVISNTFQMMSLRRISEFALLRSIGMHKNQLYHVVLLESLIIGILGSIVGIVFSLITIAVIFHVLQVKGYSVQDGSHLSAFNIVIALVLATLTTVVSALGPARKAAGTHPLEALRSLESQGERSLHRRNILGFLCLTIGLSSVILCVLQPFKLTTNNQTLLYIGVFAFAALCLLVAAFLLSPITLIGLIRIAQMLKFSNANTVGRLALLNLNRLPRRSSNTSFAMILGIGVMTATQTFAFSIQASTAEHMRKEITADIVVSPPSDASTPLPAGTAEQLALDVHIAKTLTLAVAPLTIGEQKLGANPLSTEIPFISVADADPSGLIELADQQGTFDLTQPNVIIADTDFAATQGWVIGDEVPLWGTLGESLPSVTLIGTYAPQKTLGTAVISAASLKDLPYSINRNLASVFIQHSENSTYEQSLTAVKYLLSSYPELEVGPGSSYGGEQATLLRYMSAIVVALLVLAFVVAAVSIANTLFLGVMERTKEYGALRAIGFQRQHLRMMVIVESCLLAAFGVTIGFILGSGLASAFLMMNSQKLQFADAILPLALSSAAAFLVSIAAAYTPAVLASKTHPLAHINT